MNGEMVRSGECKCAVLALVLLHVSGELVLTRKLLTATLPVALVWCFSGVLSLVHLQMIGLGLDFVAARVGAVVNSLPSLQWFHVVVGRHS